MRGGSGGVCVCARVRACVRMRLRGVLWVLVWEGSVGAGWYSLERSESPDGSWEDVASGFHDAQTANTAEIADALAKRLGPMAPLPMDNPDSGLAAFTIPGAAEAMSGPGAVWIWPSGSPGALWMP